MVYILNSLNIHAYVNIGIHKWVHPRAPKVDFAYDNNVIGK